MPNADERALKLRQRLRDEAEAGGYHLNPDVEWTLGLVEGLLTNGERYGYWACPYRLASGQKSQDLDIICPCDYRDADLDEYGACYCALYVSDKVAAGEQEVAPVPERRLAVRPTRAATPRLPSSGLKVWRCPVCGYLCARPHPPAVCPICKVGRERFEVFDLLALVSAQSSLGPSEIIESSATGSGGGRA